MNVCGKELSFSLHISWKDLLIFLSISFSLFRSLYLPLIKLIFITDSIFIKFSWLIIFYLRMRCICLWIGLRIGKEFNK